MSKLAIALIAGVGCLFLILIVAVALAVVFFLPVRSERVPIERTIVAGPRSVEPPPAALTIGRQTQVAGVGSYCWSGTSGASDSVSVCADMIGIPTAEEPLTVGGSFTARLELPLDEAPETLGLDVISVTDEDMIETRDGFHWWRPKAGEHHELPLAPPHDFSLDLEPGLYVLSVFTRWPDRGDVNYGFLVEVGS
jgi:hypothetical protein